jgi:hypothetical protein
LLLNILFRCEEKRKRMDPSPYRLGSDHSFDIHNPSALLTNQVLSQTTLDRHGYGYGSGPGEEGKHSSASSFHYIVKITTTQQALFAAVGVAPFILPYVLKSTYCHLYFVLISSAFLLHH